MKKAGNSSLLIFCILILICVLSCKKEKEEQPISVGQGAISVSTEQTSAKIDYIGLGTSFTESGVYYSTDSASIAVISENTPKVISVKLDASNFAANLKDLSPQTTYFFIIYIKDAKGKYVYTKLSKLTTKGYGIKWQVDFSKTIKLIDILHKDVILIGQPLNTDIKNYKVTLGSTVCMLWKIAKADATPADYMFYIQVPAPTPAGKYKLTLSYLDKVIFSDDLEVLKGNYYYVSKKTQPSFPVSSFSYFQHDNKLYTIQTGSNKIDSWNSVTNEWSFVGTAPSSITFAEGSSGNELNGKIWFPPAGSAEEAFHSYTPSSNRWEKTLLFTPPNSNDMLKTYGSFVYQEKIYCMVQQIRHIKGNILTENLLKVFNPGDKSWKVIMNLNNSAWDYKGVVLNGQIYLLAATVIDQENASTYFKSTLYQLDLNSKTLIKKPDILWYNLPQGSINPSLFTHNNHLFIYGGMKSVGYNANVSTDMYEFAPENDSWTRIHLSHNADRGGSGMFCNVFNDKIYIAFGLRYMLDYSNYIWELDMNK
ncbi:Kelch repeat-containing protein [Daejeonella oryzae]|uniref:hypothetical protein n=1 Tax=Daejeonella oryzae TaxID=1122943 RepID=UPI0012DBD34B|nr:hypothetical protein [Daejeonella oryzae]